MSVSVIDDCHYRLGRLSVSVSSGRVESEPEKKTNYLNPM